MNGTIRGFNVSPSDVRFKQNISTISSPLQKVLQLRGVSYEWRKQEFPEMRFRGQRNIGFIAQEVEKVLPEVVSRDDKGYLSISYTEMVPVIVEAMKEQQARIELQTAKIVEQERRFNEQSSKIELQTQKLSSLQSEITELKMLLCKRKRRIAVCK